MVFLLCHPWVSGARPEDPLNNDINILDSRVFTDAAHKNDEEGNIDAVRENDFDTMLTRYSCLARI